MAMMRRRIIGCFATLFCVLMTLPVMAAESALSLVPDGALGFVVIRDVASASEKIGKVVEQFDSEMPPLLATFKALTATNEGFDDQGDVLLALMPGEDEPQPLLALPVTDYDAMIKQLDGDPAKEITEVSMAGQDLLVAHQGDYAVFVDSDSRATLRKLLRSDAKAQAAAHTLKDWIAENDVTIVVSPAGLKLGFKKGLEGLMEISAASLEMAEEFGEEQPAIEPELLELDVQEEALKFLGSEIQLAAIGLDIDDAGNLKVGGRVRLTADGTLAKIVGDGGPVLKLPLSDVPNMAFVACGAMAWDLEWGETIWSGLMNGLQDTNDETKKTIDGSKPLSDTMTSVSMYMLRGKADAPVVSGMFAVMKVADSATYLKDYEKLIEATDEEADGDDDNETDQRQYEVNKIKIEGCDVLELKMDTSEIMGAQGGIPQMPAMIWPMLQHMMGRMLGPDGKFTTYTVVADKNTVITGIGSKEQVAEVLKALGADPKERLGDNSHVQTTAVLLPKDAIMVGYLSPQGTAAWFGSMLDAISPFLGVLEMPEFPDTPPIGFSARLAKETVEVEVVVPSATIKGLGEFVEEAQQAFGQ